MQNNFCITTMPVMHLKSLLTAAPSWLVFVVLSLQPVINYFSAKENGLGRSLFERYADSDSEVLKKMESPILYMLETQYRMVVIYQFSSCYITHVVYHSMKKFASFHLKSFMMESS